ncbi:MAG: ABC transporter ATP-binding protein, partial [Opitutae bacterium]|nr:ABC transporter ATP-binding protein [Opitutae bacterium]
MIEVRDLKVYYGDNVAVDGLSFEVEKGEVYGLIGPNGAGKTTTIKAIATLLEPTYGEILVDGISALHEPENVRGMLGYMPDFPPVYDDLRVDEFVELFASAYGATSEKRNTEVDRCLAATNLEDKRKVLCKTLSRGMKQRALLAKTLVHDPPVLLLDEPAANLDPKARIDLRNLLKHLAKDGKTILVSSHVLTELQDLCDSIGIMREGKMVINGNLQEVVERATLTKTILMELLHPFPQTHGFLIAHPSAHFSGEVDESATLIEFTFDGDNEEVANLLRALVELGAPVKSFHE